MARGMEKCTAETHLKDAKGSVQLATALHLSIDKNN